MIEKLDGGFWRLYALMQRVPYAASVLRRRLCPARMPALEQIPLDRTFLRQTLAEDILPFWLQHGIDRESGGFISHLDQKGQPLDSENKVVAMQARILYGLAAGTHASGLDICLDTIEAGLSYFIDHFWDAQNGGWHQRHPADGDENRRRKDSFTQANSVVALTAVYRATGKVQALDMALKSWELMNRHLWDRQYLGFFGDTAEDWTAPNGRKSLAVQINALRAGLSLLEQTADEKCLERCRGVANLICHTFSDPRHGGLREEFSRDWHYLPRKTRDLRLVGHQLESASALLELDRISERSDYRASAKCILDHCLDHGWDRSYGGFHHSLTRCRLATYSAKQWWTQAEGLIALGRMVSVSRETRYPKYLYRQGNFCFSRFSDRLYGEWFTSCSREGRARNTTKGGDWKGAYHTVSMCLALMDNPLLQNGAQHAIR